ncbi:MAG: hypothetical protein AB1773_03545 [Pseudomonadota bacterium]
MRRNILILAAVMLAGAGTTFAQAQRPMIETRKVEDVGVTIIAHRRTKERLQVIEDPYTPLPDDVGDTQRTIVLGDTAIELTYVGPSTKNDVEDQIALQEYASQLVREQARAGQCWQPAENALQLDRCKDVPNDTNCRPYVVRRDCGLWGRGT